MKAMQVNDYGPASDLTLVDADKPSINADQILVQVGASGVNPVDTYIRSGTNNYTASFPHTPGNDGAGTIVEVGSNVSNFSLGQRVYFSRNLTGSAAEYAVCVPTHTFPLADALSFAEGACLGVPYTTAHRALFGRAHAQAGEKVLVHGATGAVGLATVQLALAAGMNVVASAGTVEGANLLRAQGVQTVIMHNQTDYLAAYQSLQTGFDVIIEMLANHNLDQDLKALAFGGRVAVIGNRGTVDINPRDLMARDAAVMGVALANVKPAELCRIAQAMLPQFEKGVLKPVVRKEYALSELSQAHEDVLKSGAQGNLVIVL
ncbi:Phthiocerol synthesis polyketide synthase type I PpsC [Marinomonas gallaica]|uniref:Phthiocerol synthesis polyketide synthase type I PpsC n=1 Tax=Marinomonas gallaica TaxID=1806667 RepID=A0A1C3JQC1_9GAMM|nr:NADPH:quinone reductase [Marinomonas gallaica]SBT17362.1 Phthiocerol synthesis polyketide synthase type I PpsC [Marinomonas gallaica]SBT22194.1 Phthiocerol synthesis polyketide synthase type I PpsC [Marinomonas gallaica]